MVELVYTFDITVAKGGTAAVPQSFALTIPPRIVDGVEVWMPAGSNGQVHWALGAANTRVIPVNAGAYVTGNDEVIKWPMDHQIESGAWQLFAYNTGTFAHLLHVRLLTRPFRPVVAPTGAVIFEQITVDLGSGGGSGGGGGGGGGGASYTFGIETPLAVLTAPQGGSGAVTLRLDEVGTRPGAYTVSFAGTPGGVSLNAAVGSSPTALTLTASVGSSVTAQSYNVTVQVANGGITKSAVLTLTVSSGGGGGGGRTPANLSAGPATVAVGATLYTSGTGWTPGELVTVALGSQTVSATALTDGSFSAPITVASSAGVGTWFVTANSATHYATGPQIVVTSGAGGDTGVLFIPIDGGTHSVRAGQAFALVLLNSYPNMRYYVYDMNGNQLGTIAADSSGNLYYPNAAGTTMFAGTSSSLQFCTTANPGGANCARVTVVAT